jgi:hypothetical protein
MSRLLFAHNRTKKSTTQLNNILLSNLEHGAQNMEAICNYYSGKAAREDIYTLEAIKFVPAVDLFIFYSYVLI